MEAGPSRRDAGRSWLPWAGSSSASSPSSSSSPEAKTEPPPESAPSPFLAAQELKAPPKRIDFTIPSSVLVLTPTAAAVGLFIGMRRGGEKARLRFLAENVHRQPKTVQGWYFYTKTRNYRVLYGAIKEGGKTALKLGTAGGLFAAGEEGAGWLRERFLDPTLTHEAGRTPPNPARVGWRKGPVHWEDGAAAGSVLALVVGLLYRLPNPLMIRSLAMGFGLGAVTSALTIAQDMVAQKKGEEDAARARERAARPEGENDDDSFNWGWGWIWRIFK